MWKDSEWAKQHNAVRYEFTIDGDVCAFCKDNDAPFSKSCYTKQRCGSAYDNLITFVRSKDGHPYLHLILHSAIPGDNNVRELEEIWINTGEEPDSGQIRKILCDCDYDPNLKMDMSKEEAKKIMSSIPILKDDKLGIPSEAELDLKLNFFEGSEREWLRAYQDRFEEIRKIIRNQGTVEEPLL
jgi:hypothetical protein